MIIVSRVTKRSKADLRPAIARAKDMTTLEELGMGSSEVIYECERSWWLDSDKSACPEL